MLHALHRANDPVRGRRHSQQTAHALRAVTKCGLRFLLLQFSKRGGRFILIRELQEIGRVRPAAVA